MNNRAPRRRSGALPWRTLVVVGLVAALLLGATAQAASQVTQDPVQSRTRAELQRFVRWLDDYRVVGYIGEFGWPDDVLGDAERWNSVADAWLEDATAAKLWTSAWATGEWWADYNLAIYERTQGRGVNAPNTQAPILERWARQPGSMHGINVAGGAFGAPSVDNQSAFSNRNPGGYGATYHYDPKETFEYVAARGYRFVRLELRWERIQPEPGGPLDATELGRLRDAVGQAKAAGLRVILDVHNYGAYYLARGDQGIRRPIGSPEITEAHFADLWKRLSVAFKEEPALLAYGLMNEPVLMTARHQPKSNLESWATGLNGWTLVDPAGGTVTALPPGAAGTTGALWIDRPGGGERLGRFCLAGPIQASALAGGDSIGVKINLVEGDARARWTARVYLIRSDGEAIVGPPTELIVGESIPASTRFARSDLDRAAQVGVQVTSERDGAVRVLVSDLTIGSESSAVEIWEAASQAAVDSIRGNGDQRTIMVGGYHWSQAQTWPEMHPRPWIRDAISNIRYEAHHYWDADRSSHYLLPYEEEARRSAPVWEWVLDRWIAPVRAMGAAPNRPTAQSRCQTSSGMTSACTC